MSQLVELTRLCLRSTYNYFQLGEEFYEQLNGTAMGSPLSPVIANLYLESLEERAIQSAILKPKMWVRYVDDTFVICTTLGVRPVSKPARTLRQILTKVKTRIPQEKQTGVVYEIPCSDCREVYVGETKRTLKVRKSEHRQAIRRGDQKNGIAVHVQKTDHHINWEGATVKRRESGFWQRRTAEAIQIRRDNLLVIV